jgi:hypothetical protein
MPIDFSFGQDAPRDVPTREVALQLLEFPAKAVRTVALLLFYGALGQVGGGAYLILSEESKLEPLFAVVFTLTATLSLVSCGLLLVASFRMKSLRSYRFVVFSMIVACLAGMTSCPIATVAILSPLIVVLRSDVRSFFEHDPHG